MRCTVTFFGSMDDTGRCWKGSVCAVSYQQTGQGQEQPKMLKEDYQAFQHSIHPWRIQATMNRMCNVLRCCQVCCWGKHTWQQLMWISYKYKYQQFIYSNHDHSNCILSLAVVPCFKYQGWQEQCPEESQKINNAVVYVYKLYVYDSNSTVGISPLCFVSWLDQ